RKGGNRRNARKQITSAKYNLETPSGVRRTRSAFHFSACSLALVLLTSPVTAIRRRRFSRPLEIAGPPTPHRCRRAAPQDFPSVHTRIAGWGGSASNHRRTPVP